MPTTPHPPPENGLADKIVAPKPSENRRLPPSNPENLQKAREARVANRATWAKLPLRQNWLDEAWMRSHISKAGVRVADSTEPATVGRVRTILRRAGVLDPAIKEAVGCTVERYLKLNPNLPLWVAVAFILESTGQFTP